MDTNYQITSVTFSCHTEIENSSSMDFDNKIGVPHDEVTYAQAHIIFKYVLAGEELAGVCYRDVATIGTVVYDLVDGQIKATDYIKGDNLPDKNTLMTLLEGAVEAEYNSIVIQNLQESSNRSYISDINKEYAFDNQYTPVSPIYDELEEMLTGIGANKINEFIDPSSRICTITWLNYDGTVLATDEVLRGQLPVYQGETPTKPSTPGYDYTFSGWTPTVVSATQDTSYTADFTAVASEHCIESDGQALGYFLLPYKVTDIRGFKVRSNYISDTDRPNRDTWFFGVWESYKDSMIGYSNQDSIRMHVGGQAVNWTYDTDIHTYEANLTSFGRDGSLTQTVNWNNVPNKDIGVFWDNSSHGKSNYTRVYSIKLYDASENLIADYVPWEESGNVCFYDTVAESYLYPIVATGLSYH